MEFKKVWPIKKYRKLMTYLYDHRNEGVAYRIGYITACNLTFAPAIAWNAFELMVCRSVLFIIYSDPQEPHKAWDTFNDIDGTVRKFFDAFDRFGEDEE